MSDLGPVAPRGPGFYLRTLQGHLIGEPEAEILVEISRVLDLIDALQAVLDESSLVVNGKPNPVLIELRQQQLVLAKLISLVPPAVESAGAVPPPSPKTLRARRAAEARWANHVPRGGVG